VSQSHNEITSAAITVNFPTGAGVQLLCCNDGAEPPTELATTAKIRTGAGGYPITIDGNAYIYGLIFEPASGTGSNASLNLGTTSLPEALILESCAAVLPNNANARMAIGPGASSNNDDNLVILLGCSVKCNNASNTVRFGSSQNRLYGFTIDGSGTAPTTLFDCAPAANVDTIVRASDLSGNSYTNLLNQSASASGIVEFHRCKFPSGVNLSTGTLPGPGCVKLRVHDCIAGTTPIKFTEVDYTGTVTYETGRVMTGGSSDGTETYSFMLASTANASYQYPCRGPWLTVWNDTTGSSVTATIAILHDSATNLKDNEVAIELLYLSAAGLATRITDAPTILASGTDQSSSSESWDTTSMSNPNKQEVGVSFTPQAKGTIVARVLLMKASKTIYQNGRIKLS
jgi:hypothetical protein